MRLAIEIALWICFCTIIYIFRRMLMAKLTTVHPDLLKKAHRHPSNTRRKRKEGDVKEHMEYFISLKSATADSVRGFNSDKMAEG